MDAGHWVKSTFAQCAAAAALVAGLTAGGASALAGPTYTWNTTGSGGGSELTFSAVGFPSEVVKARAYWTANDSGTSTFGAATLNLFGGGIGINNGLNDSSSPQHAIDNNGRKDFLLFEFESGAYNPTGFQIGYKNTDADIQFWIGGNAAGLNLTNACNSQACQLSALASLGFTALSTFENVATNTPYSFNTSLLGRYLLVAGELTESDDYFKFSKLTGVERVPEPAALALFAAGLAWLGLARRRKARAA